MRPMVMEFPFDERFHNRSDEYMFGDQLLVAPVLEPGVQRREVLLPAGGWYDFWADTAMLAGDRAVTVAAPLARLPLFVREGAVLPARQVVQFTGEAPIDPLTLTVYPGAEGKAYESAYYEDDGRSFAFTRGVYLRRTISQRRAEGATTVRLSSCEGSYRPPSRGLVIQLQGASHQPSRVVVNGRELSRGEGQGQWMYDVAGRSVRLRMTDSAGEITAVVGG